MDIQTTDSELLSVLLGGEAQECADRPLAELFGLRAVRQNAARFAADNVASYSVPRKLAAARELIRRALAEDLSETPVSLTTPSAVRDYLKLCLAGLDREVFVALWLDSGHRPIATEEISRGTISQTAVYPREVVKSGLRLNAKAVLVAHNHPSGDATPSRADEVLTSTLKRALSLVDITLIDHFVVADTKLVSFAERGLV